MKIIKMNIADLKHPEKNIRKHPRKQLDEMRRSINMFGQFRPVVIDETNTILAGNGLVIAMREMGEETVDVLKYDNLTKNQKKKLMIADNQVASLGVDDYGAIEEVMKELGIDGDLDIPGYDEEAVRMLVENATQIVEEVSTYGVYPQEEVDRIKQVEAEREENGMKPVEQTYNTPPAQPAYTPPAYEDEDDEEPEQKTYSKTVSTGERYVICPHCGERIYL